MLLHLEILKLYTAQNTENLLTFRKVQCHYNGTNAFQVVFSCNLYPNVGFRCV